MLFGNKGMGIVEQLWNTIKQTNTKKNYTLIIPLSDWTVMYFASVLANSVFSLIFGIRSSYTLTPYPIPLFVCLVHLHSLSLSLKYPYIPGLLFLTFVVCRVIASLSIVTGVSVSVNVVKPDSGIE